MDISENTIFDWITQNLGEYISMDDRTARYIFFSLYSFIEGLLQDIFEVKIDLTARQVMEFP